MFSIFHLLYQELQDICGYRPFGIPISPVYRYRTWLICVIGFRVQDGSFVASAVEGLFKVRVAEVTVTIGWLRFCYWSSFERLLPGFWEHFFIPGLQPRDWSDCHLQQ